MKCAHFLRFAAILATCFGFGIPAHAVTVYWDINGTVTGAGGAGQATGTWDAGNPFWNTDPTGAAGGTLAAWAANDTAAFAAGGDATGAYTVTVSGTQAISGLIFEEGTVLLSGGTLDIAGAVGGVADINVAGGLTATVGSIIQGNPSGTTVLTKTGTGTLVLGGVNTFGGTGKRISIQSGTLSFSTTGNLGNTANVIDLGSASTVATLAYTGITASIVRTINLGTVTASSTGNTISVVSGAQLTLSNPITGGPANAAGNVALTVTGGGTLILTGANTFTGDIVVDGNSTLQINSLARFGASNSGTNFKTTFIRNGSTFIANASLNPTALLTDDKRLSFGTGGTTTVQVNPTFTLQFDDASQFALNGTLNKTGTGILLLANDYGAGVAAGSTVNVMEGILQLQVNAGALGTTNKGSIILAGGTTLNLRSTGTLAFGNNTTLSGSATISMGRSTSAPGNVIYTMGTFSMGAQTLTVTSGTGQTGLNDIGNLTFGATTFTGNPIFQMNNVKGSGVGVTTLGAVNDSGIARTITKLGNGTLNFSANSPSLTAGTIVNILQGTVTVGASDALLGAAISLGDTTPLNSNSAGFGGSVGGITVLNNVTVNAGSTGVLSLGGTNTTGIVNMSGVYTFNTNVAFTAAAGGVVNFTNGLNDNGARAFTKIGAGSVQFSADPVSINAGTTFTVLQGVLQISTPGALSTMPIFLGDATSTTAATFAGAVGGITLTNNVTASAGSTGVLSVGGTNTSGTLTMAGIYTLNNNLTLTAATGGTVDFVTTISDGGVGRTLGKAGGGTVTLSVANTLGATSSINVSQGTLIPMVIGALGSGAAPISLSAGKLQLSSGFTVDNDITYTGGWGTSGTGPIAGPVAGAAGTITGDIFINGTTSAGGHFDGGVGLNLNGMLVAGNGNTSITFRTGTFFLNNAVGNSYQNLAFLAGVINLGITDGMATMAILDFTLSSTATFNQLGFNQTVAGINYAGAVTSTATISTGAGTMFLNGNVTLANTTSGQHVINGNLSLNGGARVFDIANGGGANDLTVAAIISNGSLTKAGAGVLVFTGANTYTGTTSITGGFLRISSEGNLGADPAVFNAAQLTLNGGALEAASSFAIDDANRGITLGNGTSGNGTFDVNTGITLIVANVITGTGQLIKTDVGTLVLGAANTYTGGTLVTAGRVEVSNDSNLGVLPGSPTIGNIILNGGALAFTESFTLNANRGVALGPDTGPGSGIIEVSGGRTVVYNGILANNAAGTGGLTKTGNGTLTLAGVSTYTGPTAVNAGTLRLNFNDAGAPASNIIAPGSTLSMGGGTLLMSGKDGVASTQTFNGLALAAGSSTIQVVQGIGAGSSATLNFGTTYTRTGGASVNFILPASGSITLAASNLNAAGLLPGAVVNGTSFATINGSNQIVAASLTYANKNNLATWVAGDNITNTAAFFNNLAANVDINALRFNFAGVSTADLGATRVLGVLSGIEVTSNVGASASTISNGTVRGSVGGALMVLQNNALGDLTISSIVADNTSATAFVKWGVGRTILSNANTYTGVTSVNAGSLRTGSATALGTGAAGVVVAAGATLELGGFNLSGKAISLNGEGVGSGGALRAVSGTSVINTLVTLMGTTRIAADATMRLTIDVAAGNAITSTNESLIVSGDGIIVFADAISLGTATLTKEGTGTLGANSDAALGGPTVVLNLNGGRLTTGSTSSRSYTNTQININANMIFGDSATAVNHTGNLTFNVAAIDLMGGARTLTIDEEVVFGGVISNGSVIKNGNDILNLNNVGNSFTSFTFQEGAVRLGGDNVLGTGLVTFNTNDGLILQSTSTAARIIDNDLSISVDVDFGSTTLTGALTFNGDVNLNAGTQVFEVFNPVANFVTFTGVISNGGITKTGQGTLVLEGTNTFTGATSITAGHVLVRTASGKISSSVITVGDNSGFDESLTLGENTDVIGVGNALDHVGDTTEIEIRGKVPLTFNGPDNGAVAGIENTEVMGILDIRDGIPLIVLNPAAGATLQMRASQFQRNNAAISATSNTTLVLRGTGLGGTGANTSRLLLDIAPATLGLGGTGSSASIIPWILGSTSASAAPENFVRYDPVTGITPLNPATDYVSSFVTSNFGKNFSLAGGETLTSSFSANALRVTGGTTTITGFWNRLDLGPSTHSGTIYAGAGAVLFTGGSGAITGTGRLSFGSQRGYVWLSNDTTDITGTISTSIAGTAGIIVSETGTASNVLVLGADNTFVGGLIINSGIVRMGHAGALNDNNYNAVVLRVGLGSDVPTLQLNGFNAGILVTANDFLDRNSIIENGGASNVTLTLIGTTNSTSNDGFLHDGAGGGTLSLHKRGTNTVQFTATNTFTGSVTISEGTLQLTGNGIGRMAAASAYHIMSGGRFLLTSTDTNSDDLVRISDTANVNMQGGIFEYDHGTGITDISENAGPLNILAGYNIVTNDSAGTNTSNLSFDILSRPSMGAVVEFQGGGLGTGNFNRISFDTSPGLNDGIIGGWAFWSNVVGTAGTDFATYGIAAGANNSVKQFTAYDTAASGTAWTTATNSAPTADVLLSTVDGATRTVNSLKLADGIDLNLGTVALNVDTGGIIALGATAKSISNGTLTAGTAANTDIVLNTGAGNTTTISARIVDNGTGAVGFTKTGAGTVILSNATNGYSGRTSILGGTLSISSDSNLGFSPLAATAGHLRLYGGTLDINATVGTVIISANRGIELGGSASTGSTGTSSNVIRSTAGATLVYNGSITSVGDASLTLNGDVDMTLNAASVIGGTFQITGTSTVGSADVALGGASNAVGYGLHVGRDAGIASLAYTQAGGTLSVGLSSPNTSNLDVGVRTTNSDSETSGILNLAGSATFTANVDRFRVAVTTNTSGLGPITGRVTLANANVIHAGTEILLGDTAGAGSIATPFAELFLGTSNTFVTPLMTVGGRRSNGGATVEFATTGNLTLYGQGGTTELRIGYNDVNSNDDAIGNMDLSAGTLTADIGALVVGLKGITSGDSGAGWATGILSLGSGANDVRAATVVLGRMVNASTPAPVTISQGTLNMAGGTFAVAGDLSMALWQDNSGTDGTAKGVLTLTGGTFIIGGNIVKTGSVRSSALIEVNGAGAVLDLTGGTMTASQLAFRSGTIQNLVTATLDGNGVTNGTTFAALDDALILRDVTLGASIVLSNATANKGGILYEAAAAGAGGSINGQVNLGGLARTINVEENASAANDLSITGAVINGTTLTKSGLGTLLLSGDNDYSGATTVNAGTLKAGSSTAFGNSVSLMTVASGASLNVNGQSVLIGSLAGAGTVQNAAITNGSLGLGNDGTNAIFTGSVTDGAGGGRLSIIKTGVGVQTLSGLNSYTGATTVNNGTLRAGLTQTSSITVSSTGAIEFRDNLGVVLNLSATPGALALAGGAHLGFELGSIANYDRINVLAGGTVIVSGTIVLDFFGLTGFGTGTYNLISAGSGLAAANYTLGGAPVGFNYTIEKTDSLVRLIVGTITTRYWTSGDDTWNAAANWSDTADGETPSGAVPGPGDTVIFSAQTASFSASAITTLDAAFTIDSLQFINVPTGVTAVTINPGAGGSLTITPASPSNGIAVGASAGIITIAAPITLGAIQTWLVDGTGANGSSLIVSGNVTFTNRLTKAGAGALTLSGNNSGAGGITLAGGILNINSATALGTGQFTIGNGTTINNTSAGALILTTTNAQLWDGNFVFTGTRDLNLGTGAVTMTGNITVTTAAGNLTVGGAIGDGTEDFILKKTGPGILTLNGNNTFSGGYVFNGGTTVLGHQNALGLSAFEVAAASILQAGVDLSGLGAGPVNNNGVLNATLTVSGSNAMQLGGSFSGAGGLAKSGAGTLTLSGASTYGGTTLISQGTLKAGVDDTLPTGTVVFLGSTDAGAPGTTAAHLDLSTHGVTVAGLNVFVHAAAATSSITIGSGETLRVNGNVTIGPNQAGVNTVTNVTVSGAGTFEVVNTGGTFLVGGSVQSDRGNTATLNMSGLATFVANLGATGTFRIGDLTDSAGGGAGSSTVILATTSTITANTLAMDGAHGFAAGGLTQTLRFGNGNGAVDVNGNITSGGTIINANTLTLGAGAAGRSSAVVTFDHATDGTLRVRAANGTGRAAMTLVSGASSTGALWNGTFNLDGHYVDLLLNTFSIAGRGASTGSSTGTFQMDMGRLDVTGVTVGSRSSSASGAVNGTFDIGGGTVIVGNTGISVGANSSTSTSASVTGSVLISGGTTTIGAAAGTSITLGNSVTAGSATNASLIVTGGSVTLAGDIIEGTGAGNASVISTITLAGGTLDLGGNDIGNATQTINNLNFESGTLRNVASINGTAALNKTTGGLLTMEGTSAYSGGTNVNDGTVHLNGANLTGTGAVLVNKTAPLASASVLSGTGSIAGAVTVGSTTSGNAGILRPGGNAGTGNGTLTLTNSAGLDVKTGSQVQLSISSATLTSEGFKMAFSEGTVTNALQYLNANPSEAEAWNVAPSDATDHDYINLSGTLSVLSIGDRTSAAYGDGSILVTPGTGFSVGFGDVFNLFDWRSLNNIIGGFDTGAGLLYDATGNVVAGDLNLPSLGAGQSWDVSAFAKYGVIVAIGAVPEPGRAMLLFAGLAAMVLRRRRRR